jgi:hypothetical protein
LPREGNPFDGLEIDMKKTLFALMLFASVGASIPSFAAEPSLHEVYQAAEAGKTDEAQRMMHEVLQAHPNSGKAHYVEAELLAKQGQLKQAANELASAEKLAPGLPFATAQSVASLKAAIARHASSPVPVQHLPAPEQTARDVSGFPWGMLFIGLGLIAFIVWATRFMTRRSAEGGAIASPPGFGSYRPAYPSGPQGGAPQGYGAAAPFGAAPAAAPGLGSQVLGGLATGAAVGAGVVAGEALMHRFMDGHQAAPSNDRAFSSFDSIPSLPATPLDNMGGNDFGIADSSSWDDSASSSDSDWN